MRNHLVLPALAALLLAVAPAATALYLATPLSLTPSKTEADVGDRLTLTASPNNDTVRAEWAGETLRFHVNYQTGENESDVVDRDVGTVTLDGNARGTVEWTVPEEANNTNVALSLLAEDGTLVASVHVAVGEAPPILLAASSGPGLDDGAVVEDEGAQKENATPESGKAPNQTPAAGVVPLLGLGAIAAALLARRR